MERIPGLLDIAHTIQQLPRLLKPPPRSFDIPVHAKVIHSDFTWGELECRGNLHDMRVILEAKPTESVSKQSKMGGGGNTTAKGIVGAGRERNDGTVKRTQSLPSSAWHHLLMYPPEINSSSCPTQGEERHQP